MATNASGRVLILHFNAEFVTDTYRNDKKKFRASGRNRDIFLSGLIEMVKSVYMVTDVFKKL